MSMFASTSSLSSSSRRKIVVGLALGAGLGFLAAYLPGGAARADKPAATPPAEAPKCKAWGGKPKCCDPEIAAHLDKQAVFKACGESDATFIGEKGEKETCTYYFKVEGQKEDETYVQVYVPTLKEVPSTPQEPFFTYTKVGKVSVTEKSKTPKMAAMVANFTGLYLPAKGYAVNVRASTKVCEKAQAKKLAPSMK